MVSQADVDQAMLENDWDRALSACACLREATGLHLQYALVATRIHRAALNYEAHEAAVREIIEFVEQPDLNWPVLYNVLVELEAADRSADALSVLERFSQLQGDDGARSVMLERLHAVPPLRKAAVAAPLSVLAVGQQCMAHDLLTRWGMRSCLVNGPFVAGAFGHDGAAAAIEDCFQRFLDPQCYNILKSWAGVDTITIPAYRTVLNHEAGPYWLSDPDKVPRLYKARAEAFWETLASKRSLLVFTQTATADVARLRRAVERFATVSAYHLLVVDCSSTGEFAHAASDRNTTYIGSPMPGDEYVWHHPSDYNTPGGLAFERRIAEAVADILVTL